MSRLWYRRYAQIWDEALPIGNGKLGAMFFGNTVKERIQFNEETIWYGAPTDRNNEDARENLDKVRQLIFSGRVKEAEVLMKYAFSGVPQSQRTYQSLGDMTINIEHENAKDYRRELILDDATGHVYYDCDGVRYEREYIASAVDNVIAVKFTASRPGSLSFDVILTRERFYDGVKKHNGGIMLYGNLGKGAPDFAIMSKIVTSGGKYCVIGEHMVVSNADSAVIYVTGGSTLNRTNLSEELDAYIDSAIEKGYEKVRSQHIEEYKKYYDRVDFWLKSNSQLTDMDINNGNIKENNIKANNVNWHSDNKNNEEYDNDENIPMSIKLLRCKAGIYSNSLFKTYFDFGRYLLISCSREGTYPANLQGIWNDKMKPSWDSKYTININTEMNYWPAEMCNLSECHMPLFEHIKRMVPNGEITARKMYGCRGFVAHHNTDIYADTAVVDHWIKGSYWVMGAAWLCTHIWMHYEYTKDISFLKEYYPIVKEACEFFIDYLVEDKRDGYLKTCPSVSPENSYILPNGDVCSNSAGVTMDNELLRDLFTECIKIHKIISEDEQKQSVSSDKKDEDVNINDISRDKEFIEKCEYILTKLAPLKVGKYGQIMEWSEDYEELNPGHRHISHLYALYPSEQILAGREEDEKICKAAKVTLERRLSNGGGHTGWSRAWIINFYAALWDSEKAYYNLCKLLEISTLPNLFDNHPPFQIDGNFGATAAICNMIVQSTMNRIVILPALPKEWNTGHLRGVRVKGGARVDIEWKDGILKKTTIYADRDDIATKIMYRERFKDIHLKKGDKYIIMSEEFI